MRSASSMRMSSQRALAFHGFGAMLVLAACERAAPSPSVDGSTMDAGDDTRTIVDALPDADRTVVDVPRPPAPDAPPDDGISDGSPDRAIAEDAHPLDVPDKFGDVAEAVDGVSAPDGAITATVTVGQMPTPLPGGFLSVAGAFFRRSGGATAGPLCSASTMGACSVRRCLISYPADAGAAPMVSLVGAGQVEVDGLRVGRIVLPRTLFGDFYAVNRFDEFFRGGETLRVRASGDAAGMPPFVAAVTAPIPITLTAPTPPVGTPFFSVTTAEALPLRWTGGGAEPVIVSIAGDTAPAGSPSLMDHTQVTVECRFPTAVGAATIPIEVMVQLRGSVSGTISVHTEQTRSYRVAPHVVTFAALATAAQWTATFR